MAHLIYNYINDYDNDYCKNDNNSLVLEPIESQCLPTDSRPHGNLSTELHDHPASLACDHHVSRPELPLQISINPNSTRCWDGTNPKK